MQEIRHILGRNIVPKGTLRLEITESLVMENPEQATEVLELLRGAGAELALDDFGTGYSSLAYLSGSRSTPSRSTARWCRQRRQQWRRLGHHALDRGAGARARQEGRCRRRGDGRRRRASCARSAASTRRAIYYGEPMSERDVSQLLKMVRRSERKMQPRGFFRPKAKSAAGSSRRLRKRVASARDRGRRGHRQRRPPPNTGQRQARSPTAPCVPRTRPGNPAMLPPPPPQQAGLPPPMRSAAPERELPPPGMPENGGGFAQPVANGGFPQVNAPERRFPPPIPGAGFPPEAGPAFGSARRRRSWRTCRRSFGAPAPFAPPPMSGGAPAMSDAMQDFDQTETDPADEGFADAPAEMPPEPSHLAFPPPPVPMPRSMADGAGQASRDPSPPDESRIWAPSPTRCDAPSAKDRRHCRLRPRLSPQQPVARAPRSRAARGRTGTSTGSAARAYRRASGAASGRACSRRQARSEAPDA